jgi:predicted PurR-regulated permease PerM
MFTDEHRRKQISATIDKIKKDVKSYFVIKTLVSMVTAGLSYFVMTVVGLDFAVFWACLIFVLNFIPSIGSIIAVTFPILLSMIQFEGYYVFLFTATGLI